MRKHRVRYAHEVGVHHERYRDEYRPQREGEQRYGADYSPGFYHSRTSLHQAPAFAKSRL